MLKTQSRSDEDRADRWLAASGGPDGVSPAARDLLGRRLRERARAGRTGRLLLLPIVVVLASAVFPPAELGTSGWGRQFAMRFVVAIGLLAIALAVGSAAEARADRRLASSLIQRVSRGQAVPAIVVFGRLRGLLLATLALSELAVAIGLISGRTAWLGWGYLAAVLATGCFAVTGIRRVLDRPTIAIDAGSLAIDERLRAGEALAAAGPLIVLCFGIPVGTPIEAGLPAWCTVASAISTGLGLVLLLAAGSSRRWAAGRPGRPAIAARPAGR